MPDGWYKLPWKFTSKACYKLDIIEDYDNLPLLWSKDVYLLQAFINNGYKGEDLKQLNFFRKYICAVSLADVTTVDKHKVMYQAFEAHSSNGLCNDIIWPRSPDVLPRSFIIHWKLALAKCFLDHYSNINRRLPLGLDLKAWVDVDVDNK